LTENGQEKNKEILTVDEGLSIISLEGHNIALLDLDGICTVLHSANSSLIAYVSGDATVDCFGIADYFAVDCGGEGHAAICRNSKLAYEDNDGVS
jgi:hypothetical protein